MKRSNYFSYLRCVIEKWYHKLARNHASLRMHLKFLAILTNDKRRSIISLIFEKEKPNFHNNSSKSEDDERK